MLGKKQKLLYYYKYIIYILHFILSKAILGPFCTLTYLWPAFRFAWLCCIWREMLKMLLPLRMDFCLSPIMYPLSSETSCSPESQQKNDTVSLQCDRQAWRQMSWASLLLCFSFLKIADDCKFPCNSKKWFPNGNTLQNNRMIPWLANLHWTVHLLNSDCHSFT